MKMTFLKLCKEIMFTLFIASNFNYDRSPSDKEKKLFLAPFAKLNLPNINMFNFEHVSYVWP